MFSLFARLKQLFQRLRNPAVEDDLRPYQPTLAKVNQAESHLVALADQALQQESADLRARTRGGAPADTLLVEAFALVREASRRVLGMRPFDVQVLAGIVLDRGKLAEMQTGEGKTLAAVLPAYLNGLTGAGVHVLTFNDYLAQRDAEWMGPLYRFLGLRVAHVRQGMTVR